MHDVWVGHGGLKAEAHWGILEIRNATATVRHAAQVGWATGNELAGTLLRRASTA